MAFHCVFSKLFSLLGDADLGAMAADGFSLLMSDSADVLNRGCHADVRIMYRQRFFSENSAKLVQGFNAAPQGTRRFKRQCEIHRFPTAHHCPTLFSVSLFSREET